MCSLLVLCTCENEQHGLQILPPPTCSTVCWPRPSVRGVRLGARAAPPHGLASWSSEPVRWHSYMALLICLVRFLHGTCPRVLPASLNALS
jgi:hypothetical protein